MDPGLLVLLGVAAYLIYKMVQDNKKKKKSYKHIIWRGREK